MRFAFIRRHASEYPLGLLCRVLGVSRSGYYAASARPRSARRRDDEALAQAVARVHLASRRTYGAPRVHHEVRQQMRCSRKRVARLMRQAGLRGAMHPRRRRWSPPSAAPAAPDLLGQRFAAPAPDRVWCADTKQIWTRQGWLHVAAVIDLYSRRVVGLAFDRSASTGLVSRALRRALRQRRPAAGLVHHSDQGSAYRSEAYRGLLRRWGARASMSRPGTPLDNAVVESFFSTLSRELLLDRRFTGPDEARAAVRQYVESFYNRDRRHSSLAYASPVAFEASANSQGVSTKAG